jgi:uncharacterized membrane protein YagU involved in acid resistance
LKIVISIYFLEAGGDTQILYHIIGMYKKMFSYNQMVIVLAYYAIEMSVILIVSYSLISSHYAKWNSWTGNVDHILIFPTETAVTSCLAKVRLSVHMFY